MSPLDPVDLLVVEDNPSDMELTLRALRKAEANLRVHVLKDGAEALDFIFARGPYAERASLRRPKLILLDLKLPKVGGTEVLKAIRENERTRTIPVVMLTSSEQERDVLECYRLGANSYVVKPIDFARFAQDIARLGVYWLSVNHLPPLD